VIRSILITKSKDDKGALYDYCISQNIAIRYHSFLTFKQVNISETTTSDVLFFSSKRAVDYFLQQTKISENTTVACIGESTKIHLQSKGIPVHFVGKNAGQPEVISQELAAWLGDRTITVVLAKESKKSILTQLNSSKISCYIVYETIINSKIIEQQFDCIVFTSPSNAEGFLKENTISETTKVIAWGETTKRCLMEHQLEVWKTLKSASEEELIEIVKTTIL
jgi:uroporphyrinogen-III synthase